MKHQRLQPTPTAAWHLIGEEEYTRKDGSEMILDIWGRPCAHCNLLFTAKVPHGFTRSAVFGMINCPDHRLTRAEAAERWVAKRKENALVRKLLE